MTDQGTTSGDSGATAKDRRTLRLLALGAAAGLLAATAGILEGDPRGGDTLEAGVVARVGDATIRLEEYRRLLAGLESDRREPADAEMRRHVLERMIDEELLVQRAVELGLIEVDRRVRANLTSAMISSIVDEAEDEEPSERDLREFYAENADFFTHPGRLRVRQIFFRSARSGAADSDPRPQEARRRLAAGEDFASVRSELGDPVVAPLPDTMLPPLKLREYLGPTALRTSLELEIGGVSEAVPWGMGTHILQLVDREDMYTPAFEDIRSQVENEWRRQLGDRALRAYLDGLREEIDIVVSLPDGDA